MPEGLDLHRVKSLLDGPAPAVLATHRKDGSVKLSPVWFRHAGDYFEVVIADEDVKLKHITQDPRVTLLIFESTPPFRGVQVSDEAEITRDALDETRRSITSRYLDEQVSKTFTENRKGNGAVVRIPVRSAKTWDLAAIAT
jgi:PPOX class probable F420-dependent enzyme